MTKAYRHILVAVDGSRASSKGLREAIRLAKAEGAKLCIVHVVDEFQAFASIDGMVAAPGVDLVSGLRKSGEGVLAKAKKLADHAGVPASVVLREMVSGPAASPIVGEARKLGVDLIVLGTHGRRGVRRLVLGSDAEQVVRTASVPVLLVRE
jgi:nucleotide-binding universal stress UspA family protein